MAAFSIRLKPVNLVNVKRILAQTNRKRVSAGHKALKAQGKEAQKRFRADIRAGRSGSSSFEKLKNVSRFSFKGDLKGPKRNRPMAPFAKHIKTEAIRKGSALILGIGFVKGSRGGIAKIHQRGQTVNVSKKMRKFFAAMGGELRKKNKKSMMKYFFLKSTTTTFTTPAREMVEPFWEVNEREILSGVKALYLRFVK